MNQLVSVMIPCHNATRTLPLALSSLLSQTYDNWECLVVDDGSEDQPDRLVSMLGDPRVRYVRLGTNHGRGFARQVALEMARGDLICMLDADDWYYPSKLQDQLDMMENNKDLVLISSGMAIVDRSHEIKAVRRPIGNSDRFARKNPMHFGLVPFPFAPSIVRTETAKRYRFDGNLRRAEDADFLLQLVLEHKYGISPQLHYVYTELDSVDIDNVISSIRGVRLVMQKYSRSYPVASRVIRGKLVLKTMAYRLSFRLGIHQQVILKRSQRATPVEKMSFEEARRIVFDRQLRLFGDLAPQKETVLSKR